MSASFEKRFAAQTALPGFGREGQKRLENARVLVIGAGGLGCPALQYLATSGVGKIGIIDADTVSESNLARQVLYAPKDVGRSKVEVAEAALRALSPRCEILTWKERFSSKNEFIVDQFDLVLDCTDNFSARFDIIAACAKYQKPQVFAAAEMFEGLVGVFHPIHGACYACAVQASDLLQPARSCSARGVLGPVTGILGAWQAAEAIRWIVTGESPLLDRLCHWNFQTARMVSFAIERDPLCPFHGNAQSVLTHTFPLAPEFVSQKDLREQMESGKTVSLFDVREDEDLEQAIPGSKPWPLQNWLRGEFPLEVTQGKSIVVYCERYQRAWMVANVLEKAGWHCKVLEGGWNEWESSQR